MPFYQAIYFAGKNYEGFDGDFAGESQFELSKVKIFQMTVFEFSLVSGFKIHLISKFFFKFSSTFFLTELT